MSDRDEIVAELAQVAWLYDEYVGVGDVVDPDYCDCEMCQVQSRYRRALDAYASSVAQSQ